MESDLIENLKLDGVLVGLFRRHFHDPAAAVVRLDRHLSRLNLPFKFRLQLRELRYPPQPGFPNGIDSFVYYYVPNSGWGSNKQFPADPLHRDFVYYSDGIGLNLGCPVRLLRALDAFERLSPSDQIEVQAGLANSSKHLATVEEILWLDAWRSPTDIRRGGRLDGATGDVDWTLKARGFPIYLEAKFRPSDWPRISEAEEFTPIEGSFLKKAAHKFPNLPAGGALHLVGITAFQNITLELVHMIGRELESHPNIHGVVFKTLGQMTHLLSVEPVVWSIVAGILARPAGADFPTNYFVPINIPQRNSRITERAKLPKARGEKPPSRVLCDGLQPRFDSPLIIPPSKAYKLDVESRADDGEPRFIAIPEKIWASD